MVKSFLFDGKLLETRLLMHFDATTWVGYTYKWDEAQTDATAGRRTALEVTFTTGQRTVDWHFPSRQDCRTCHIPDTGTGIRRARRGDCPVQSGRRRIEPDRQAGGDGRLRGSRPQALQGGAGHARRPRSSAAPRPPRPSSSGRPPTCTRTAAFCHRPRIPTTSTAQRIRASTCGFGLPLASRNLCNVAPAKGGFGLDRPEDPGARQPRTLRHVDPDEAAARRQRRQARPHAASSASYVVDQQAVDLIGSWITSITICP